MKYRIKEECRKYFNMAKVHLDSKNDLDFWTTMCVDIEALEEVESKIIISKGIDGYKHFLLKNNETNTKNLDWTEKERELVEFCLNEFQDLDDLKQVLN